MLFFISIRIHTLIYLKIKYFMSYFMPYLQAGMCKEAYVWFRLLWLTANTVNTTYLLTVIIKIRRLHRPFFFALFFYYPSAVNEHNADISALTFMFLIFYLNKGIWRLYNCSSNVHCTETYFRFFCDKINKRRENNTWFTIW